MFIRQAQPVRSSASGVGILVRRSVWKPLLQARAIENLAYVCGVNRVGTDGKGFDYAGESVVYSPKGELRFREKFPAWMDEDEFQLIIHHS